MSLFKRITSSSALGIDIGTSSIKAVELTPTGSALLLSNYALLETINPLERFNNALQSSNLKPLEDDLILYLKALKANANFKTTSVHASLPAFTATTTLIELPVSFHASPGFMSEVAQNYIPLPIATVTLQYIKVGEKTYPDGTRKQQILLVSIPNERVESYYRVFSQAGFNLEGIEIEQQSLCRALTHRRAEPTLVIDIGGRSTALCIAEKGALHYSGQTDFASGSLTSALASALNISERRADQLKRQTLIVGRDGDHELSTIVIPIIDVIISEAVRVKNGFEKAFARPVTGVILSGSGVTMPGFEKYMSEQLGLPVITTNPLSAVVHPPELEPLIKSLGGTLSTALGLALKKFITT